MKSRFVVLSKYSLPQKYKPLFLFVAKAAGIFLLFLFFKYLHRLLIDTSSHLQLSDWLRQVDAYAIMADTMIYPAGWILKLLGYETVVGDRTIHIVDCIGIIVHGPCMGLDLFGALLAFVAAYPSKFSPLKKVLFIITGILLLHFLNVIRVVGLLLNDIYKVRLPIEHHDLYNLLIYGFLLLLFYFWIKYSTKSSPGR